MPRHLLLVQSLSNPIRSDDEGRTRNEPGNSQHDTGNVIRPPNGLARNKCPKKGHSPILENTHTTDARILRHTAAACAAAAREDFDLYSEELDTPDAHGDLERERRHI